MIQLTKEQAIELAKSGIWKNWTNEKIVKFQLYQDKLCMDFCRFHEAVEKVLGRSVWTHEFASSNIKLLREEYEGLSPKPSFEEIVNLLPQDKIIFVVGSSNQTVTEK